ncbi:MAG TPA: hypothetical protein VMP68_31295 [Candidatus Eisenbacteria bacterium]|nr:hypothetical protein [Candidatus Eisenbacteria bacterium]
MAIRRIQCRAHPGGIFTINPKRGRQPVSCKPEYPCDRVKVIDVAGKQQTVPRSAESALVRNGVTSSVRDVPGIGKVAVITGPQRVTEPRTTENPSLTLAKAAKERLTSLGWACKGRAGFAEDGAAWAELTCSRGAETLVINWQGREMVSQQYALEFDKPQDNGVPESALPFNPDEVTDSELVRLIKGMKVTWWNTIAGAKETAVIGGTVTVEHIFRDNGDEDNAKRVVKFLDHGGGGFRAFHVSSLLKVG